MIAVGVEIDNYTKSLKWKKKPTLEVVGWLSIPCFVSLDLTISLLSGTVKDSLRS